MSATLYVGIEIPPSLKGQRIIHCPLIRIVPRPKENIDVQNAMADFSFYTHLIFTSRSAVNIFFDYAPFFSISIEEIKQKTIIAVGRETASRVSHFGASAFVAIDETAEGVIELLKKYQLQNSHFFWPHSALSRPVIDEWLSNKGCRYCSCVLYDTEIVRPQVLPNLNECDKVIFSSPSTIDAFILNFGKLPSDKELICKGPITEQHLLSCQIY